MILEKGLFPGPNKSPRFTGAPFFIAHRLPAIFKAVSRRDLSRHLGAVGVEKCDPSPTLPRPAPITFHRSGRLFFTAFLFCESLNPRFCGLRGCCHSGSPTLRACHATRPTSSAQASCARCAPSLDPGECHAPSVLLRCAKWTTRLKAT